MLQWRILKIIRMRDRIKARFNGILLPKQIQKAVWIRFRFNGSLLQSGNRKILRIRVNGSLLGTRINSIIRVEINCLLIWGAFTVDTTNVSLVNFAGICCSFFFIGEFRSFRVEKEKIIDINGIMALKGRGRT